MQTKLPWLCAVLLGVIGWLIGYSMNSGPSAANAPEKAVAAIGAPGATTAADPETARVKDFEQSILEIMEETNQLRQSHRLCQLVENLSVEEFPGAVSRAMEFEREKRDRVLDGLMAHWMELDPHAALKFLEALPEDQQFPLRSGALAAWASEDFEAASRYALEMAPGKKRNSTVCQITASLAKIDPVGAVRFFEKNLTAEAKPRLNGIDEVTHCLSSIVRLWAAKDFDAAGRYALAIKDRNVRSYILPAFVSSNPAGLSPQYVLDWIKIIPDRETRETMAKGALENLASTDPQAALQYARALSPGEVQRTAVMSAISQLGSSDPAAALREIENLPLGEMRTSVMESLITTWVQRDATGATRYAKSLPEGVARSAALSHVATSIALYDPFAALEVANFLPAGEQRRYAMGQISHRCGQVDPKNAAEYFYKSGLSDNDFQPLWHVLDDWVKINPEDVLAWADKLPGGKEKNRTIATALGEMAINDPQNAARSTLRLAGEELMDVAPEVASNWAKHDPVAASLWATGLPEGNARERAFSSIAERWAQIDAAASAKWLGTLAPDKSRDSAVSAFIDRITEWDPEGAVQWAATIGDKIGRASAMENVARTWMENDKASASAWVQSTNLLSDEIRRRLLGTQKK